MRKTNTKKKNHNKLDLLKNKDKIKETAINEEKDELDKENIKKKTDKYKKKETPKKKKKFKFKLFKKKKTTIKNKNSDIKIHSCPVPSFLPNKYAK